MSTPPNGPSPSGSDRSEGAGDLGAPWSGVPAQASQAATTALPTGQGSADQPTVAVPVQADWQRAPAEPVPGTYWQATGAEEVPAVDPLPHLTREPAIFPEGVFQEPPSRAGAHLWVLFLSLALSPIAWFLLNDGSARVYWSLRADPEAINIAGLVGLGAGLLVASIVLLAARWSSVGASVAGSIGFLAGLAFLVAPVRTLEIVGNTEDFLNQFGGFGANLYGYLVESGIRGQLMVSGFVLIGVAVVSHGARRKGRREEFARLAVRAARGENPFG